MSCFVPSPRSGFGAKAALLAMFLLVVSPRYFGHAMNNPKDIPFAAMGAAVLCCLAAARPTYPYFSRWQALVLAGAIALAINVRAGGLLYLCYTGLVVASLAWFERERDVKRLSALAARLVMIAVLALVLGTLFWPWAQQQPLVRPIQALEELTHHTLWDGVVLYKGQHFEARQLPWDYPFYYFLISTPPVVLAGAVLSLVLIARGGLTRGTASGLWFAFLFPVGYVVARGSILYDGVRQLLFAYPPLVIVSAAGWIFTLRSIRSTSARVGLTLMLGIGLLEPLVFQVRNHPYQTVYFNQIVGGPQGALFRFELDYWGNSLAKAVEWVEQQASRGEFPVVISAAPPLHVVDLDTRRRSIVSYVDREPSDFHVSLLRDGPTALKSLLARPDIVHVVRMADGTPLSVITAGTRGTPSPETR